MEVKQNKLSKSQIEIEFELTAEEFSEHMGHTLEHLKRHIKADGFRPGHVPDKIVEEKVGKEGLLMEAGDHAVHHVYSEYIGESGLEPIGQPEVSIVKIAQGSPFVFKAKITVLPEIELPDYKEIAKKAKAKEISVSDDEERDAINHLQKSRAKFMAEDRPAQKKDFVEISYQSQNIEAGKDFNDKFILGEGGFVKGFEENIEGMKAGEEKTFKVTMPDNSPKKELAGKEVEFKVKLKSVQKVELPEINDDFAKSLGAFDTLVALKSNIKEGLMQEKEEAEKQRKRGEILEKITEGTKIEIPDVLIEYEKQRLLDDLKNRISIMKISFEEYLSSIKQTEENIKDTFQKEAERRLRGFLVLKEIGKKEEIEVSDQEIEEEIKKLMLNYQQKPQFDKEQLKEYTKGVIYNEKVFKKLEDYAK